MYLLLGRESSFKSGGTTGLFFIPVIALIMIGLVSAYVGKQIYQFWDALEDIYDELDDDDYEGSQYYEYYMNQSVEITKELIKYSVLLSLAVF